MSLISLHNVSFTYPTGNAPDFDQISFSFDTDWKTGLIGRNGKGKTTLFALLQVKEDVLYQPFDTLSYGEQTKVMLAGLFLTHHDYLLIDEPTNHLDASGREILSAYLRKQKTGYMIVSHDRDFLDGLVTKFYEFDSGVVREHLETVQEFLQKRKLESLQELDRKTAVPLQTKAEAKPASKPEGKKPALSYEQQKELSRQEKKKKDRIKYLEAEIEKQEKRMKEIEEVLSNPPEDCDIMEMTREYLEFKRDLDAKTDEWGSLL